VAKLIVLETQRKIIFFSEFSTLLKTQIAHGSDVLNARPQLQLSGNGVKSLVSSFSVRLEFFGNNFFPQLTPEEDRDIKNWLKLS